MRPVSTDSFRACEIRAGASDLLWSKLQASPAHSDSLRYVIEADVAVDAAETVVVACSSRRRR
jgi:hypothetical protein